MQNRVQQLRLRSWTGLALISGFSLIVWIAIALGIAQFQHNNHPSCRDGATAAHATSPACQPGDH